VHFGNSGVNAGYSDAASLVGATATTNSGGYSGAYLRETRRLGTLGVCCSAGTRPDCGFLGLTADRSDPVSSHVEMCGRELGAIDGGGDGDDAVGPAVGTDGDVSIDASDDGSKGYDNVELDDFIEDTVEGDDEACNTLGTTTPTASPALLQSRSIAVAVAAPALEAAAVAVAVRATAI
jgi:hypothetical protein